MANGIPSGAAAEVSVPVIRPPPISMLLYSGGVSASCPGIPMYDWNAFTAVSPVIEPVFAMLPLATEPMTPLAKVPPLAREDSKAFRLAK